MKKEHSLIVSRTDTQLIQDWKLIDSMKVTQEIATVRGWLMDEIEKRWPKEFDSWMEGSMDDDRIESYIKL